MEVDDENDNEAHEVLENADYDLIVVGKGPFPSTVKDFESLEKLNDKKSLDDGPLYNVVGREDNGEFVGFQ
jgi:hypothetical protein